MTTLGNPVDLSDAAVAQIAGQRESRFLEPFIVLAKHKFHISYCTAGAALLSVLLALLLPKYYTGTAKLMPPQQGQSIAAAMADQLGSFAPLASIAGLSAKNPTDLYLDMLRSRTVADALIERFSLMPLYGKKNRQDTRKRLEQLTEIKADKSGIITVAVEDRDPSRAAGMANAYIEELEKLTKTLAVTDASKRRIFFEGQVRIAREDLAQAEQVLKQTEEKTGIIQLDSQSRVMLEGYAELRAQLSAQEVVVHAMRSFATAQNPDLIRAEQQLNALRSQVARYEQGAGGGSAVGDVALEKVPARALEYVRNLREVRYRESLLALLLKQYEIARIDEGKEAALIQLLDRAVIPEKKSWPTRWIIVVFGTILGFLIASLWAFWSEALARAKEDPHYLARLQLLRFYLRRGAGAWNGS